MALPRFLFNFTKYLNVILSPWRRFWLRLQGVMVGKGVEVIGRPHIDMRGGGISLGNRARLVSAQANHEIGLPSRVVLTTRGEGVIEIGDHSILNGATIRSMQHVRIGSNVWITAGCYLMDSAGHSVVAEQRLLNQQNTGKTAPIVVEDEVWFGINVIVMPGVTIGRGAVIGAGSIVTSDIPAGMLAVGNPAKPVSSVSPSSGESPREKSALT